MNKNQKNIVLDLFMEKNDKEALNKLYSFTNDELVKIVIEWNKKYKCTKYDEDVDIIRKMYEDIIHYIFNKYSLN